MIQIEAIDTAYGTINILRSRTTGAVTYELGGRKQSLADENGVSLASYIHAIFGLLSQAKPRNILLIGCAGGTLGTMLARARCDVSIVDVNPISFALAKQYFNLPEEVTCYVADGSAFLRSNSDCYDAIVLDAFHGEHIPSHLLSSEFFELARERLTPRGAVYVNIHVKHDFDDCADRLAQTMKSVWDDVFILDAEHVCDRNAIVMAGKFSKLRPPRLLVKPQANIAGIDGELAQLKFRAGKGAPRSFGR